MRMELTYSITVEDMAEYCHYVSGNRHLLLLPCRRKRSFRRVLIKALAGCAGVTIAVLAVVYAQSVILCLCETSLAGALIGFSVFRFDLHDWRCEPADGALAGTPVLRVTMTRSSISVEKPGDRARLLWRAIQQVSETPSLFVLGRFAASSVMSICVLVPKRAFASAQAIEEFRTHVRANCPCFSGFPVEIHLPHAGHGIGR